VEKLKFADSGASGYVTFDDAPVSEGGSGTAVWARLKFQTRERGSVRGSTKPVCCVCNLHSYEKGAELAACGHGFHADCLSKWQKEAHEHGHDAKAKCPMCRQEIKM